MKRTPESVESLKKFLIEYNSIVDEFSYHQIESDKSLNLIQKTCNDFLQRTRLNVEGLIPLLDLYKFQMGIIQPISLILRSCLSDFMTFCYLTTFAHPKDESETTLLNELCILEKDFLSSMMEVLKLESNIADYHPDIPNFYGDEDDFKKKVSELKQDFGHLFKEINGELVFKKPKELRDSSLPDYFDSSEERSEGGTFLTESKKWERMARRGLKKYVTVFIGFKFFSQFQHYSKISVQMINKSSENQLFFHLVLALNTITIVTDMQIQIIDPKSDHILQRLRKLEEMLDSVTTD